MVVGGRGSHSHRCGIETTDDALLASVIAWWVRKPSRFRSCCISLARFSVRLETDNKVRCAPFFRRASGSYVLDSDSADSGAGDSETDAGSSRHQQIP